MLANLLTALCLTNTAPEALRNVEVDDTTPGTEKNLCFIHCPRANMCSKYSHQIPRMCPHSSYMGFEAPGTGSKEYSKFKPETISIRQHGPTCSFPYNVFLEKKSRFLPYIFCHTFPSPCISMPLHTVPQGTSRVACHRGIEVKLLGGNLPTVFFVVSNQKNGI